jgi:hypothetical protein
VIGNNTGDTPQTIIAKAREYESSGRAQIALLILEGGVIRHSEEITLLEEYVALARSVAQALPAEQTSQQLANLALFVQARISFVSIENIERVVALADEISAAAEAANTAQEEVPLLTDAELAYLESIKNNSLSLIEIAPAEESSLSEAAHSLERLLDYASTMEFDSRTIELIREGLEQVRSAQQFDLGLAEAIRVLDSISSSDECFAGYLLQQADQILRNLAVDTAEVSSWRNKKLISVVQRLSIESEATSAKVKERDAQVRFKAFEAKFKNEVELLNSLPSPGSLAYPDGVLQKKIAAIQKSMQGLLELSPALSGTEYAQKITVKFHNLQAKAIKWSQEQQRRYDQWAMSNIRKGYQEASEHISKVVLDDEEKIARAIICHFAEIDVRLLSPEVQRTYSEIFEIVYGRLNAPKRDEKKDFTDKGGKLYTLKEMMGKPKKSVSDF